MTVGGKEMESTKKLALKQFSIGEFEISPQRALVAHLTVADLHERTGRPGPGMSAENEVIT